MAYLHNTIGVIKRSLQDRMESLGRGL